MLWMMFVLFLSSSPLGAVDCGVRALLLSSSSSSPCAVDCGGVGGVVDIFVVVPIGLDAVKCAVGVIFVGGIGLYILALLSVVSVAGFASSSSCVSPAVVRCCWYSPGSPGGSPTGGSAPLETTMVIGFIGR